MKIVLHYSTYLKLKLLAHVLLVNHYLSLSPSMTNRVCSTFSSKDRTFDMIRVLCKQRSGLNVCHINAQSLRNKIDEFRFIFDKSDVDVICVTETWFNKSVSDAIVSLDEFKIFRCDRETLGGGVSIYVKKNICSKFVCKSDKEDKIEYLFVELLSKGNSMLLGCVYRPNCRINTDTFQRLLENITINYEDVIVCGDFNSNILVENKFLNDMLSIGLHPTNTTVPTHFSNTTNSLLDIFFVSNKKNILIYDQLIAPSFSRHDLIFLTYNFEPHQNTNTTTYHDFKHINHQTLLSEMGKIDWSLIYYMPSVDNQLSFLETNVEKIFTNTVPLKNVFNNPRNNIWFNSDIKSAILERNYIFRRWKQFRTNPLRMEYCIARRKVTKMIKDAKTEHYSRIFSSAVKSNKTWKTLKDIGIGKSRLETDVDVDIEQLNEKFTKIPTRLLNDNLYDQLHLSDQNDNAFTFACVDQNDVLSSCFAVKSNAIGFDNMHPKFLKIILPILLPHITFIFNTIITKSIYPAHWKTAKIIPIPKAGNEYRPIAILPYLSKVFEKLLHCQISEYLKQNDLLTERQSGFRPKRSCITALVDVSEEIRRNVDVGNISLLVLLDHSKAFDCVNHNIICMKLKTMFNFSSSSTGLISSYLNNRHQYVSLNNRLSQHLPVANGVPQGSILGPLLFTMYINDLADHLLYCDLHLYADDVQIYISCSKYNFDSCINKLNEDLRRIHNWASENCLCINPSKSKCLVIRPKQMNQVFEPDLFVDSQRIEIVTTAKNLGVTFNKTLTWSDHILSATGKTYSMLRTLRHTQYFTPINIRLLLAKTYLMPNLLYGCELFASTDCTSLGKLNGAYNAVVRYVYGLRKYDHISSFTNKLYGVTFLNLLNIRALILLHKIIYTHEPPYLFNRIIFTRSNRSNNLIPVRRKSLMSEWQFYVHCTYLWNLLPSSIQFISNTGLFKKAIFEHYN